MESACQEKYVKGFMITRTWQFLGFCTRIDFTIQKRWRGLVGALKHSRERTVCWEVLVWMALNLPWSFAWDDESREMRRGISVNDHERWMRLSIASIRVVPPVSGPLWGMETGFLCCFPLCVLYKLGICRGVPKAGWSYGSQPCRESRPQYQIYLGKPTTVPTLPWRPTTVPICRRSPRLTVWCITANWVLKR